LNAFLLGSNMVADSGTYSHTNLIHAPVACCWNICRCAVSDGSWIFYAAHTWHRDSDFQQINADGSFFEASDRSSASQLRKNADGSCGCL
jgi:hypothetical protein